MSIRSYGSRNATPETCNDDRVSRRWQLSAPPGWIPHLGRRVGRPARAAHVSLPRHHLQHLESNESIPPLLLELRQVESVVTLWAPHEPSLRLRVPAASRSSRDAKHAKVLRRLRKNKVVSAEPDRLRNVLTVTFLFFPKKRSV